jgi:hypothetical protein
MGVCSLKTQLPRQQAMMPKSAGSRRAQASVLEQAHLPTDQGAEVVMHEWQDRIGHRL